MRVLAHQSVLSSTLLLWLASAAPAVCAQSPAQGASGIRIYTCTDDNGRKITADRPIAACAAKEQRVLNRDGSLRDVYAPVLTVEERAAHEARDRRTAEARATLSDAARRDRNLLARYPTEELHHKIREAALDTARAAIKSRDYRLKQLAAQRVPLMAEAEFYKGRPLPPKLRSLIDANDAASEAQRDAAQNLQTELERINSLYDTELARLQRLWAGAAPGSLGSLQSDQVPIPVASSASSAKTAALR